MSRSFVHIKGYYFGNPTFGYVNQHRRKSPYVNTQNSAYLKTPIFRGFKYTIIGRFKSVNLYKCLKLMENFSPVHWLNFACHFGQGVVKTTRLTITDASKYGFVEKWRKKNSRWSKYTLTRIAEGGGVHSPPLTD